MSSLKDGYHELLALTQLYLLRECPHLKKLPVSPDSIHHYASFNTPKRDSHARPLPQSKRIEEPVPTQMQPLPSHRTNGHPSNEISERTTTSKIVSGLPNATPPLSKETKNKEETPTQDSRAKISVAANAHPPAPTPSQANPPIEKPLQHEKNAVSPHQTTGLDSKKTLTLTPLPPHQTSPTPSQELWNFLETHFSQIPLKSDIPDDALARKNKHRWQESTTPVPILILSFDKDEKSKAFLKSIAQAITLRFAPARVVDAAEIEKENNWNSILNHPTVKLIIASDYHLYLQPNLMQHHQENPQVGKHFLSHHPLLLLSELKFYFENSKMKAYLWRAICTEFAL